MMNYKVLIIGAQGYLGKLVNYLSLKKYKILPMIQVFKKK